MYRIGVKWEGRFFIALAVLILALAFQQALAETDQATGVEAEAVVGGANWDANERVMGDIEEWKRTSPMARSLLQRDDVQVVVGIARVKLSVDDKRWPKARSMAYQEAFMKAMGEYVSQVTKPRETTRLIRERFQQDVDESELAFNPGDTPSSQLERVIDKLAILGERKLDQALTDSGMSEEANRPPYSGPEKDLSVGPNDKRNDARGFGIGCRNRSDQDV